MARAVRTFPVPPTHPTDGRFLLYPTAPTGTVAEELPHSISEGWQSILLVLPDAGVLQRNGVDVEEGVVLVDHEFHNLYVVESDDRLAVDVGHQTAFPQTYLPCWTSLVHFRGTYSSDKQPTGLSIS